MLPVPGYMCILYTGGIMKQFIPSVCCSLFIFSGCFAQSSGTDGYRSVPMTEAVKLTEQSADYTLLDVRTEQEYRNGHIPGAILLPNEHISPQTAETILPDKNALVLVYCRSGNRSKQAAGKLTAQGYTNIVEIGGINSWTGPVVTE